MYTTVQRIFNSIFENIKSAFMHLGYPIVITVLIVLVVAFISYLKHKENFKQYFDASVKVKFLKLALTVLYFSFVLEMTLFKRIGIEQVPPLSELWRGWSIFDTELRMYVDFSPVINAIMLIPVAPIFRFAFGSKDKLILKSTIASFAISSFIEASQVIFHLGTLQISDLFYNTFGGFIGALILTFILKYIKKNDA